MKYIVSLVFITSYLHISCSTSVDNSGNDNNQPSYSLLPTESDNWPFKYNKTDRDSGVAITDTELKSITELKPPFIITARFTIHTLVPSCLFSLELNDEQKLALCFSQNNDILVITIHSASILDGKVKFVIDQTLVDQDTELIITVGPVVELQINCGKNSLKFTPRDSDTMELTKDMRLFVAFPLTPGDTFRATVQDIYLYTPITDTTKSTLCNNNEPTELPTLKGEKGEKGDPGRAGIKGEVGPQGPPGIKAEKGDKGDKGQAASLYSIVNETLPADQYGEIVNVFRGFKGDTGDTGSKGDKGDPGIVVYAQKGDKGDPGTIGYAQKGDKGDRGTIGYAQKGDKGGPTKEKGENGRPEEPGLPGLTFEQPIDEIVIPYPITDFIKDPEPDDSQGYQSFFRNRQEFEKAKDKIPIWNYAFILEEGRLVLNSKDGWLNVTLNSQTPQVLLPCIPITPDSNSTTAAPLGTTTTTPTTTTSSTTPPTTTTSSTTTPKPATTPTPSPWTTSSTTQRPRTTTRRPWITTQIPWTTTRRPWTTTRRPWTIPTSTPRPWTTSSTTQRPRTTTRRPWITTQIPWTTTRRPWTTTGRPWTIPTSTPRPWTSKPPQLITPVQDPFPNSIRLVALNTAMTGNFSTGGLYGRTASDKLCHEQGSKSLKTGQFKTFAAASIEHLNVIVDWRFRHYPVINLRGDRLFPSWSSIFQTGFKFSTTMNLYSFDNKNVQTENDIWPYKKFWHGSSDGGLNGSNERICSNYQEFQKWDCDGWRSASREMKGLATSIDKQYRSVKPEMVSCDTELIVLCIEHTKLSRTDWDWTEGANQP